MQDRFNFKCWHEPTKTMYEVFDFNKNFIKATPDLVVTSIRTLNAMDCVLIQCTGLKDKNGKLIYEGDILDLYVSSKKLYRYEVKYEIGSFMLVSQDEIFDFPNVWNDYVYPLSQLYYEYQNEENCIDECEIIGNVYENPELLNDNQKRAENLITNPESKILDSIKRAKIKTDIGKAIEELIDNE